MYETVKVVRFSDMDEVREFVRAARTVISTLT